jgi:hypothetical protein
MSRDSIFLWILACFIFAAFGFGFGISFSKSQFRQDFEREAIKKGHATWVADKDGNSTFQWKEASK